MKLNKQLKSIPYLLVTLLLIMSSLFLAACGPSEPEMFKVGFITNADLTITAFEGFIEAMTELGYVEGENITYVGWKEYLDDPVKYIAEHDDAQKAQELIDADVDLIVSTSTPSTKAAQEASEGTDTPIVFSYVTDPIASGLIEDYARPGGRATGVRLGMPENAQDGLRLEWMKKIMPDMKRVHVMYNPDSAFGMASLNAIERVAPELGVELVHVHVHNDEEADAGWENLPEDIDAIFSLPSAESYQSLSRHPEVVEQFMVSTATKTRVEQGAVIAFGQEPFVTGKTMARLADQILHGTDPADLPVEVPEFFLFINLKTADTLGIEISDDVLRQASIVVREDGELVKD